ncbi:MAG: type I-F CRISPR-associated endoribonuclease Cas6/Csy4 [Acidovorax sp.]|nr:type I-F CRISPR-associated endoribonuclease Cas6/Csy4 [Acidovorax sp.]
MTTHYIDITLLPDPEFSHAHLQGALVAKLHRALVQLRSDNIGISFPQYSLRPRTLGTTLRLHGGEAALQCLMDLPWLQGMRDHVQCTPQPTLVPEGAVPCLVQRRQFKTNPDRLRRRRMRRKGETAEQAAAAIPDSAEHTPDLPYVQLHSASTGQSFCLFISQKVVQAAEARKGFNTYGMSLGAVVPLF